jgi:hypothetical protein
MLQTLDLKNVNDPKVKHLNNMIQNTYLAKGLETGYI